MDGMILAAGKGTRLHPLTAFRAKPSVPFLNRPFIHYSLELLRASGVKRIVINLHHLPQTVRDAVSSFPRPRREGLEIHFSEEREILGTGGAFRQARDLLSGDPFIVSNGKIYFEGTLDEALRFHRERKALVTLVLYPCREGDGYQPVFVDDRLRVTGFAGTGTEPVRGDPFVFTGIQVVSPELLESIPEEGPCDTVLDVYPRLMTEGRLIQGFVTDAYWCEASFPRRYLERSLEVLERRGLGNLSPHPLPDSCARLVAGRGVEIGPGCSLEDCILWDGVRVGEGSTLSRAVVTDGVHLPPGTEVSGAIITPRLDAPAGREPKPYPLSSGHLVWPL